MGESEHLAKAVDRELKGLPEIAAPQELTERVMAGIREMEAVPWWRRSWFEWPAVVRVATAAVMAGWLIGIGVVDWSGLLTLAKTGGDIVVPVMEWGVGVVAMVPWLVWGTLGLVAMVSWFTLLAASVFCWQLVRARR